MSPEVLRGSLQSVWGRLGINKSTLHRACLDISFPFQIIEKTAGYDRLCVLREIDLLHFLSECP